MMLIQVVMFDVLDLDIAHPHGRRAGWLVIASQPASPLVEV